MILMTGGAGYIGSHTAVSFLEAGFDILIIDNLCNSSHESINRIEKITFKKPTFINGDIRDKKLLLEVFNKYDIELVIHFSSLKAVGESIGNPLEYYDNNIYGTLVLLEAMKNANIKNIIFSSSATVYGEPDVMPITENTPVGETTNPYGTSKAMIEKILQDVYKSDDTWNIAILRYFNPIGAHRSGLIGEDPSGVPNNLIPYISQVAVGKLDKLNIYGSDYPTIDGTGVRDYIHVVDLASGHLAAAKYLNKHHGCFIWNLGTGSGNSVLEVIKAFESVSGLSIDYEIMPRRAGDIAECWADCSKATNDLGWNARYDLTDMVADTWRWQQQNINGYE